MSPWIFLGFAAALAVSNVYSYFEGKTNGRNAVVAENAAATNKAVENFTKNVDAMIATATAKAFADEGDRLAGIEHTLTNLANAQENADAAFLHSLDLARPLQCWMSNELGLSIDEWRRPAGIDLTDAAGPALRIAVPAEAPPAAGEPAAAHQR